LSVEDDELTAEPPTNDAVDCRAQASSEPHRSVSGARLRRLQLSRRESSRHRGLQSRAPQTRFPDADATTTM
jgi:hypothetical protein